MGFEHKGNDQVEWKALCLVFGWHQPCASLDSGTLSSLTDGRPAIVGCREVSAASPSSPALLSQMASPSLCGCTWYLHSAAKAAVAACAARAGEHSPASRPHVCRGPQVSLQGCAPLTRRSAGVAMVFSFVNSLCTSAQALLWRVDDFIRPVPFSVPSANTLQVKGLILACRKCSPAPEQGLSQLAESGPVSVTF